MVLLVSHLNVDNKRCDYLVKLPDAVELIARIRYHSASYISLRQRDHVMDFLSHAASSLSTRQSLPSEPRKTRNISGQKFR